VDVAELETQVLLRTAHLLVKLSVKWEPVIPAAWRLSIKPMEPPQSRPSQATPPDKRPQVIQPQES